CFTFFPNDGHYSWLGAQAKCAGLGLKMAHPRDAIGLRSYMWQEWGFKEPWLNLMKEVSPGTNYIWQDNGVIVTPNNPFWFTGEPIDDCVILLASSERYAQQPDQPFFTRRCEFVSYYALCEKILPGPP
ncbi:unnamed protein product, partial [Meganyctiphanes norvegica]